MPAEAAAKRGKGFLGTERMGGGGEEEPAPWKRQAKRGALVAAGKACDVIDVRTPAEFAGVHAASARLVPLDTLFSSPAGTLGVEF